MRELRVTVAGAVDCDCGGSEASTGPAPDVSLAEGSP